MVNSYKNQENPAQSVYSVTWSTAHNYILEGADLCYGQIQQMTNW